MQADKLIRMANQIATNLAVRDDAASLCAQHISDYWDPSMRAALLDLVAARATGPAAGGGAPALHPLVVLAAPQIRRPPAPL